MIESIVDFFRTTDSDLLFGGMLIVMGLIAWITLKIEDFINEHKGK